jgi:hypothetical protein
LRPKRLDKRPTAQFLVHLVPVMLCYSTCCATLAALLSPVAAVAH